MGPRLFSRGRSARQTTPSPRSTGFNGAAALQPRKVCHRPRVAFPLILLQWGRGSSAAEGSPAIANLLFGEPASMGPRLFSRGRFLGWCCRRLAGRLQWGRGSSAAEGPQFNVSRRPPPCFNGAAALQPRKEYLHNSKQGKGPNDRSRAPRRKCSLCIAT